MSVQAQIEAAESRSAELIGEVEAICNLATSQNRNLSEKELARVNAINGVGDELGELGATAKTIDTMKRNQIIHNKVLDMCIPILDRKMAAAGLVSATAMQRKSSVFASNQEAYDAGQFFAATLFGNRRAREYCEDRGIRNAMTGSDDLRGGSLVPEGLESVLVALRENFGTFRSESTVVPMSSDVLIIPKVVGELTSYYVSENSVITPSDMSLTQLRLVARKLATLTAVSSELNDDAIISIADSLTQSIAYSFANKEDQAGFLGDGTATYGGIMGLANVLAAGSVVTATARTTFGALTMADFEGCVGKAKMWAGSKPKWFLSQQGWANSMQRLLDAAGGNTLLSLAMGAEKTFLGFEVVINQVLPSTLTGTTGTLACFFGDLKQGVYFGSRRGVSVQVDPSVYFTQDALAVRATERYDINVHDIGDASNAGGIVKLIFG